MESRAFINFSNGLNFMEFDVFRWYFRKLGVIFVDSGSWNSVFYGNKVNGYEIALDHLYPPSNITLKQTAID